jgi:hypothetical protein
MILRISSGRRKICDGCVVLLMLILLTAILGFLIRNFDNANFLARPRCAFLARYLCWKCRPPGLVLFHKDSYLGQMRSHRSSWLTLPHLPSTVDGLIVAYGEGSAYLGRIEGLRVHDEFNAKNQNGCLKYSDYRPECIGELPVWICATLSALADLGIYISRVPRFRQLHVDQ